MFRRIKKTTALLLAVMMLISVTPFSALASIIQPQVDTSGGVSLQSIYDGVGTRSIGDPETAKREYSFFDGDKLLSGAARPQTVKNDEYLSEPVLPAKENYIFIGWYDASEGGEKFDFSIPVTDIVYKDETANLYARYTPAVNLVFMDKSGRIFKIKQGAAGTEIPLGDVVFPVDQDETITGWSETPAGDDVQEKLPDPYTLSNKDKVIYPIIEKGYWLSCESKGGTYIEPVFCEGGQKPAQPEAPTRLGYDFAGWFMQNDTPFSFTDGALLTDGTTIYAKWNPQSAAVSYTEVYWIENDKGTGYLFEASATKWAQTDTLISDIGVNTSTDVINSDYREHFEYDSDAQNKTEAEYKSVTVKGDGSTTVNVYFTRKTYTLFFYDKSSFWSPKLVATISAKYNQSIKDEFPIENYEGRAWESTNTALYPYALQTLDRMPGANVEFNLYSKNSKIKKNIYYYTEELNGEYSLYKTVETFFKFITYDEEYHPIQGFDRETPENAGFERTYSGGWRKNFENNEVSLYYLRASYPLTFSNGGEIVRTDTYKFEADLTNAYNFIPEKPAGIPSAYEFRGWYTSEDGVEGTNAGRYPMELSEEQFIYNDPNFKDVKFNIEDGYLEINPFVQKLTVTITENSGTDKYDGTEKTVEGYTVKIDNELYTEADFTFSGDAAVKGTNAGTYNMELKPEDFTNESKNFTNVEFVIVDGTLEITKREVTLTSASDEKVYDGTALTNDTVTVGGDGFVEGEGATYDVTGSQLDVGESKNTFKYKLNEGTLADNYVIETVEGTLKVTVVTDKVTVTITEKSGTDQYDGTEKTVEGYDVEISNPLYTEDDFTFSGDAAVKGTNAGTYEMELKPEDFTNESNNFKNVEFVIVDGTLEITKREVKLTSASDEKVYDGTALTNDTVTVGGDGFAEGEGATYYVTGKRLNVGASDNAFTYTLNDGTLESNYKIMMVEGLLKVTEMLSSHYSLFWMSDTKIAEQGLRADAYKDMISWVRNNADEHEAFALVTTGNIVNYANNDAAWKLAESEIKTLPEELRYYPTAGQSDVDGDELNFVPYVGHCESVSSPRHEFKEGHIWYQSQAGHRLVLMGIDYKKPAQTPKEEKQQKQWLSAVNDAAKYYKNYSIVLLVNGFMDEDGNLTEFGQLLDQQVLSRNANIRLVLCGNAEGTARWAKDYGTHTVNGLMFNYQNDEENGLGFLRVLTFNDENRSIEVYTYSPTMNRESYDAEHPELDKFTLFNAY